MQNEIEQIKKYVRAANYLTVTQIYLKDNYFLNRPLSFDDIKPRLLGHWGTCPGINFVYATLNNLIKKTGVSMAFVLGPGHGFPALQANLFLEGTLSKYYKDATRDDKGIEYISKNFSWPYGFPSHSSPITPGTILEGGELGYSLSTSYGAVLDNPDLVVACLVGDGEAETGPLATSWHLNKFIDPATNGAVLPILHLNGYKISGPTIFGRMSDKDLKSLFRGYGYEPYIVKGNDDKVYKSMVETLSICYAKILEIQRNARNTTVNPKAQEFARFPMIILKTPKGWTGPKKLGKDKIEGNCLSHQVVGKDAKTKKTELNVIEKWLKSYKIEELFNENGFCDEILSLIPDAGKTMGDNKKISGQKRGDSSNDIILPATEQFEVKVSKEGRENVSAMRKIGAYLSQTFKLNKDKRNIRLFSPDETYSNRLQDVFTETTRAFTGKIESFDKDIARDGRVIEMLSEHSMQGLAQGYVITGRYAVFASYEAFMPIVSSMADQFSKFMKIARKTEWRGDIPSLNYILTSSGWRQEHNGFSHQNPGFIDGLLQKHNDFINVYFPADANEALEIIKKSVASKNEINIIIAEKTLEPVWLSLDIAKREVESGLSIWDFASDENPDLVFSACGQYLVKETLAAIDTIKDDIPEAKIRFVNIVEISPNSIGNSITKMSSEEFARIFTIDKPVIFNFHGYPETLKQSLFDYQNFANRFSVHGYLETGSTTTAFDLHIRNRTDRYSLAIEAVEKLANAGKIEDAKATEFIAKYNQKIKEHYDYIKESGTDPEEIEKWQWKS